MRGKNVFVAGLLIAIPLAVAVDVKTVRGSEPPGRLVDNNDGTITDTVTHLIWQKIAFANDATGISSPATAATACAGLTNLGAFTSGWRAPAIKELVSIVDYESATTPMIDTAAFPNTIANTSFPYYTTSPTLCVAFINGQVTPAGCDGGDPVRCVHSPP